MENYRCGNVEDTFTGFITNALFLAFIGFQIQNARPTFTLILVIFSIIVMLLGIFDYYETLAICQYGPAPWTQVAYIVVLSAIGAFLVGISVSEYWIPADMIL